MSYEQYRRRDRPMQPRLAQRNKQRLLVSRSRNTLASWWPLPYTKCSLVKLADHCEQVADFHRTLIYGGVAMNPRSHLRLLYEANPLAFVAEQSGGRVRTIF